jgi:hypothetical protein
MRGRGKKKKIGKKREIRKIGEKGKKVSSFLPFLPTFHHFARPALALSLPRGRSRMVRTAGRLGRSGRLGNNQEAPK